MSETNKRSEHATFTLTEDQRKELASALQIEPDFVPQELGVAYISDPKNRLGVPENLRSIFSPALIIG
jgi:hypothetical protein